jgi:hypothetical protein
MRARWFVVSVVLASCASNTTTLDIQALGEPGVTVWYGDMSTTLDANGRGTLVVPRLHVISYGPSERALVDAHDVQVTLHFERGTETANESAVCLAPLPVDGGPIDGADLLLRRVLATGACQLVAPSIEQNGNTLTGRYEPALFDDRPCGAFVTP